MALQIDNGILVVSLWSKTKTNVTMVPSELPISHEPMHVYTETKGPILIFIREIGLQGISCL